MKQHQKTKYNMWSNTWFMMKNASRVCKSVIPLCVILAVLSAGVTIAELLITPGILHQLETRAPLHEVILTILIFSSVLMILTGLKTYVNENTLYGRIEVRMDIINQISRKLASTSYPNLNDTAFINMEEKASHACSSNNESVEYIWSTWTVILTNVIGFVVYLLLLSTMNAFLMGVVVLSTTLGYFLNKSINEWGYRHKEEEASYIEKLTYIRNVDTQRQYAKDIRIFGLQKWLDDVWYSALHLYRSFVVRREKVYLWTNVIDLLLLLARNGIAYAYLIDRVLNQGMSASEFLLYFSAVSGFSQWVTGILDKFSELHKESLDICVVREFLEWPEQFQFEEGMKLSKEDKAYEIKLEQVSFCYPNSDKMILSDIDLTIHPGEKLAIVGLNGAGKTTLIKLICGFLDPVKGRVLLDGQDIRKYNRKDVYALYSAVFQDFSVLQASVAENVAQKVDEIDVERVWECLDKAGLTDKIKSLPKGIDTHIGREVYEDGVELSGGQMQRLMLARALYKDGPILALDEPTAALDPIAENDIYMKYSEMTSGKTSLFISHRLASTRFCDRILYIADGKIIEEGTHEELLKLGGGYAKLFEVQSQYYKEEGNHEL